MEKWAESLRKARNHLSRAEHMLYVSFVILHEYRMIMQIFEELYRCANCLIVGLMYKERAEMRIQLYKDARLNMKVFREKVALRYMDKESLGTIIEILGIWRKHKDANMEFVRKDRFVMLIDGGYEVLGIEKVKGFLGVLKKVLCK